MVTLQSADNALKSYYLDAVTDQLNTGVNPFLAKIRQTTSDVYGKDVKKVVRYGVNGGVGAGTEEGALPAAGGNNYLVFTEELKNLFGSICISDKAIKASASDRRRVRKSVERRDGIARKERVFQPRENALRGRKRKTRNGGFRVFGTDNP